MDAAEHSSLLRRAMAGNHEAFKALVEDHRSDLMAVINARLPAGSARSLADDVYQEATLAASASLQDCPVSQQEFKRWFLRIARNKAIDKLRKISRRPDKGRGQNADAASSAPGMSQIPGDQTSPSSNVADEERDALLHQAVQQLDERQRMAIQLHVLEKFSNAETAERMSLLLETPITAGQVKNFYRQGLKRLQELLPRESAIFTDVVPKAEK